MKNYVPVSKIMLLCLFITVQATAQPANQNTDEIIIKFKSDVTHQVKSQLRNQVQATKKSKILSSDISTWQLPKNTLFLKGQHIQNTQDYIDYLNQQPEVVYAEPNYAVQVLSTPNDPQIDQLWGIQNNGQTGGLQGADMRVFEAWDIRHDATATPIAILDTGIDWQHEDLIKNVWQNLGEDADGDGQVLEWNGTEWTFDPDDENGIDDDGNGYDDDFIGWDFVNNDNNPYDDNGHGTHVAGIAGARGNNGIGTTGIAWEAQLLALKVFDANGSGSMDNVIAALDYTIQQGIKITNNSWGTISESQALYDAINNTQNTGQIFVAAAGNNATDNDLAFGNIYPASYDLDNIIAVASTNQFDQKANFSNYGAVTIDIGTPGKGIYSTLPGNSYGYLYGTSMSAPYLAGAAALLWSEANTLAPLQVKNTLLNTAQPLPDLEGKCVSGGRLDLFNALHTLTTPNADFEVTNTGLTIDLAAENISSGTTYQWNFGDGASATSSVPTHTYTSEGNYPVCLTVTKYGQSNTFCKNITVIQNGNTNDCETEWTLQTHGDRMNALAPDGEYIWAGTTGGLLKFNTLTDDFIFYSTVNSDLPHNDVLSVATDLNGYLWVGTGEGGAAKFDGTNWTIYNTQNSGIPNNRITDIAIAPNGEIWIATEGGGAARFDGNSTWQVYDASNHLPSGSGYGFNVINDIEITTDGTIWIGMRGEGLVKFDGTNWINYRKSNGLNHNNVRTIASDSNTGNLWLGTQKGMVQFTPSNEQFTLLNALQNINMLSSYVSPQGEPWFGNAIGLHQLHTDGTITIHNGQSTDYELRSSVIRAITQDENGNMWIGTGRSLTKYDGTTWTGYRQFNDEISGNDVLGIKQASSGEIFVGTYSDVMRILDDTIYRYSVGNSALTTTEVRDILADDNGTIWLATRKGIAEITQFENPNNWTIYDTLGTSGVVIGAQDFHSLAQDHNGTLWAGITNGGLYKYDGATWTYISPNNSPLPTYAVRDITFDPVHQNIWIATAGKGLVQVDANDNWTIYNKENNQLRHNTVNTVTTDNQGNVWYGTDWGMGVFDGIDFINHHPNNSDIIDNKVLSLHTDSNTGNVWVGTKEGLCKFDGVDKWTAYDNGSINISDPVQAIEITDDGRKWIGTYGGLSILAADLASFSFDNYSPCTDSIITFYNTSENTNTGDWYVNDVYISSAPNITYNFPSKGIYEVKLIANDGGICTSEFKKDIIIGDNANLLELEDAVTVCDDYFIIKTELEHLASYRWYFDNMMVGNQSEYTAMQSGQYILNVEDPCGNTKSDTLQLTLEDNCVWSGDTNDDGIVNLFDVLRIGRAYNTVGIARPNPSIEWEAQTSEDWNATFFDDINYKHTDTNGDGIIDINDIDAILANYKKTHGLNPSYPASDIGGAVQLVLNINQPTILNGVANTTIGINLEHTNGENINAYGLAFTLNHSGTASTDFSNSSFGNSSDILTFEKSQAGQTDIVIIRKDKNNIIGNGTTAIVSTLEDLPHGEPEVNNLSILSINNVRLIDKDGNIIPIGSQTTTYSADVQSMDIITNAQPLNCEGLGEVQTSITGGTPPYTYTWSNGTNTQNIANLETGLYHLTVTDANGMTAETTTFIDDKSIRLNTETRPETNGLANGTAAITVGGGTGNYSYLWSTGQTGENIVGLESGTYTVTVTDESGCMQEAIAIVPGNIQLNMRVFLEGNYIPDDGMMHDDLRKLNLLPLTSPYHSNEKTLTGIFSTESNDAIVDWLKIKLLDPITFTILDSRSALLQRDGDIVELDGKTSISMSIAENRDALLLIRHRNHLGIISPNHVEPNTTFNADFTQQNTTNFGAGQKQLPTGEWLMYAGNAVDNTGIDEEVNGEDKGTWFSLNGNFKVYTREDFNLNGDVNGADKIFWQRNNGTFNNLPE